MTQRRSMSREIGTALAVLAIYLLTILAPLHEARASQLAFEELGYSTLTTGWVLCTSLEDGGGDSDNAVSKCPVSGVGKPMAVAPGLAGVALDLHAPGLASPRLLTSAAVRPASIAPPSGPRGPPTTV
tara:strand:+ start:1867 stop:2250 length:384 start_codon:yes stop_codon:yes gene_type:complete